MNCFTEEQLNKISHLIQEIEKLSDVEKLFLYIQLPSGKAEGKNKFNGAKSNLELFTKKPDQETTQTYTWILSHLEVDQNVSLPKQEVYDEYKAFCQAKRFEPLCVADFGKAMKHAFPCIKPRRLGQRGSSRYCYSGLRKKYKIQPPNLPDLIEPTFCMVNDCSQAYNQIIRDCRDNPDECPLNGKPNFTGYEVMNLKIEPAIQQEQFHTGYLSNGPQQPGNNGSQPNHDRSIESQRQHELAKTSLAGGTLGIRPRPVSANGHYSVPPSATSQPPQSYAYADSIQQPGTPDDDDYRHRYQDLSPVINLFHNGASNGQPVRNRTASAPEQPPSTSNFMYQVTSCTSKTTPTSGIGINTQTTAPMSQSSQHFQQPQETNNTSNTIIGPTSNNSGPQGYPPLAQIDGAHIDYCASPFQSPASTPYPMMCNYLPQDIHDYYPPDCMRYSD